MFDQVSSVSDPTVLEIGVPVVLDPLVDFRFELEVGGGVDEVEGEGHQAQ